MTDLLDKPKRAGHAPHVVYSQEGTVKDYRRMVILLVLAMLVLVLAYFKDPGGVSQYFMAVL